MRVGNSSKQQQWDKRCGSGRSVAATPRPGDVNIHGSADNTGAWMELWPMPNM